MKKLLFIMILITIMACNDSKKEKEKCKLTPSVDLLNFAIPPSIHSASNNLTYAECNGEKSLIYASNNDLHFFDLEKGKLAHTTKFHQVGPDGIGSLQGFFVHNFDSIYLVNTINILLADTSGTVKKRIELSKKFNHNLPVTIIHTFYSFNQSPIIDNFNLYLTTYLVDQINTKDVTPYSMGVTLNLLNDSVSLMQHRYPPLDNTHESYFSRAYLGDNIWLYGFVYNNEILKISNNNKLVHISAKSGLARDKISRHRFSTDFKENSIRFLQSQWYGSLIYDKWRRKTYRIFYPGMENIDKNQQVSYYQSLREMPEQFSVIILDENLNKIGETLMPKDKYNPRMFFVNEDGLHFALHVNHPEFDPDYLKFARFTVEPVKE